MKRGLAGRRRMWYNEEKQAVKGISPMNLIETMTSSELIFDGRVVHLYRDTVTLPDGASAIREIVRHIGAVCVVPITDDVSPPSLIATTVSAGAGFLSLICRYPNAA